MELLRITVPNWDKYNERSDRKNHVWFRFQNDFFADQKVFGLSPDAKLVYVMLLCEASKKGGESFPLNPLYGSAMLGLDTGQVVSSVKHLAHQGLVELDGDVPAIADTAPADDGNRQADAVLQTDRQTDRQTNKQAGGVDPPRLGPSSAWSFFDRIWGDYRPELKAASIEEWSIRRKQAAKARWKDKPDPQYWEVVLGRASKSPFLRGERDPPPGRKRFRANIDWFLRPDTHVKIMEGLYDDDAESEGKKGPQMAHEVTDPQTGQVSYVLKEE